MPVELTALINPETAVAPSGEPPMPPTDLIFDYGIVLVRLAAVLRRGR